MARYKYQNTFTDQAGNILTSGTVSVFLAGGTTAATIYDADTGGSSSNSVTSDSSGYFEFWVDDGDYDSNQEFKITLSKTNFTTQNYDEIAIYPFASAGYVDTIKSLDILTKGPWHDVRAYGAGSGESAATNTTAIQEAIDAIESAGYGILLLPEMYTVNALNITQTTNRQGIIIEGLGKNTGFKANGDIDILTVDMGTSNRQGFTLRDVEFDMNSKDAKCVVLTQAGQLSVLENIFVDGVSTTSTKTLFELGSAAHVIKINNFTISGHNNKTVKGISLASNVITCDMLNLQGLDVAIFQVPSTAVNTFHVRDSRIDNNNRGIEVDTASGIKYVFRDNHFEANTEYSIYLKGSNASNDRLLNVSIKDSYFTGLNGATTYGIFAQRIKGLHIIDNDFKGSITTPLGRSIEFSSSITGLELRGNTVSPLSDPIAVTMEGVVNALHIDDVTIDQYGGGALTENTFGGRLEPISRAKQFTDSDATPDISVSNNWLTNTSTVTITDFGGGYYGQTIVVQSKGAITYDMTGTSLKGYVGDLVTADGDITVWYKDATGGDWILLSFSDISVGVQTLTGAGAVDIITLITHIVTNGVNALSLVDGIEGQRKFIVMKTDVDVGTLTPDSLGNGSTITFDDVGDSADLLFTNSAWHMVGGTATLA